MRCFDVIVVGGGMTGSACALAMADLGLTVALVEKKIPKAFEAKQAIDLRVSAISLGSEQLLTALGVWQKIKHLRVCPYQKLGVWELEQSYIEFDAQDINQSHLGHIIENRVVQYALWEAIENNNNIKLFTGCQVANLVQTEHSASLTLINDVVLKQSHDSHNVELNASMIVGADGAHSWVRKQANIGCTGWNYAQSAMVMNVKAPHAQKDITWQKFTPTGPLAMLPLPNNMASLVWYDEKDSINQLVNLSDRELTAKVNKVFPEKLGSIEVVNKAAFSLTRQHANNYIKGNIVLIGDAAHTINPLAGQGVNLGFKDVKILQHTIASAIANGDSWYNHESLNRYEKKRRPDNLMMMSAMDAFYATFSNDFSLLKGVRNLGLALVNHAPFLKKKALAYACGIN